MITQSLILEFLDIDFESGNAIWKFRDRKHFTRDRDWKRWNTLFAGKSIKHNSDYAYSSIKIFSKKLRLHRVIFLAYHGYLPKEIDHYNRIRDDNAISNLRDITHSENMKNLPMNTNNTSGITGVDWRMHHQKWRAYIDVDGIKKHLGSFDNIEDAAAARKAAEVKYGFHINHGI